MSNQRNICNADSTVQIMLLYQYLCLIFQLSIAYCGSKKSIYIHVCVLSACVVEHFVGDLCSRFKPLSTLHLCSSLSLSLSLFVFPSISLTLTPSFSLSGAIETLKLHS